MKKKRIFAMTLCFATGLLAVSAQQVMNDNNTPLHLMQPHYHVSYGIQTVESVKQTMDRVLRYIKANNSRRCHIGQPLFSLVLLVSFISFF